MNDVETSVLQDWGGLVAALVAGLVVMLLVQLLRKKTGSEIGMAGIVFGLVPVAVWLLMGGHVSKFSVAGVEFEAGEAILAASRAPVGEQVSPVEQIIELVEPEAREAKGAVSAIPNLVARRIEALEFRLGLGGVYFGDAIRQYLQTLTGQSFFRYVVIFEQRGGLFGVYDEEQLVTFLELRQRNGYQWFADTLNSSDAEAREDLAAIPGFVPGGLAITSRDSKQDALTAMEENDVDLLPVVSLDRGFVGVVERNRLTASLILDVTAALSARQR